ncbi:MAG: tRNA uridine-5-carboxymethylaminomethyl(34) synthesis GTPase MnmE [Candidatus Ratteibacteria bacterium]
MMKKDTICAISTPPGISGIGIIRISGTGTRTILGKIFLPKNPMPVMQWPSHSVRYGHIVKGTEIIDETLVTFMKKSRTYTREDMAEIGCHGGFASLKKVLSLCIESGCRLAQPGEFTKRAFLNGRIDLPQAESVLSIILAQTEKSLEISLHQLSGSFSTRINLLRSDLLSLSSDIEGMIDFSEVHGLEDSLPKMYQRIDRLLHDTTFLLNTGKEGKIFIEGIRLAIVGKPNVGKSSLLNLLCEEEKALVSEIPGTTRDAIETMIAVQGIPLRIVDTAGIRKPRESLESLGIERAKQWMQRAEIVLLLLDGSLPLDSEDDELLNEIGDKPAILIKNKSDLPEAWNIGDLPKKFSARDFVTISCIEKTGIDMLESRISQIIEQGMITGGDPDFYLNLRQEALLKAIQKHLSHAWSGYAQKVPLDMVAEDIRSALSAANEITGRGASEELLDTIFGVFCIGK